MASDCTKLDEFQKTLAADIKEDEEQIKSDDSDIVGLRSSEDPKEQKFYQSLQDTSTSLLDKEDRGGQFNNNPELFSLNMDKVQSLLDKAYGKSGNRQDKERMMMLVQLQGLINSDPDIKELVISKLKNFQSMDYKTLADVGRPVRFSPITNAPILSSLPLRVIRPIYADVMRVQNFGQRNTPNYGKVLGRYRSLLAMEFMLPMNFINETIKASPAVRKFIEKLPEKNSEINKNVNQYLEKRVSEKSGRDLLIHPVYKVPLNPEMARHNVGIKGILDHFKKMTNYLNINGKNMLTDRDMQVLVKDMMTGRAVIRQDPGHVGEIWSYNREAPIGTYENGDTMFDWVGEDLTQEEQEKNKIPKGHVLVPYKSSNKKHIVVGDPKLKNNDVASEFDATFHSLDLIFMEVFEQLENIVENQNKRKLKIIKKISNSGIKLPDSVMGIMKDYDSMTDEVVGQVIRQKSKFEMFKKHPDNVRRGYEEFDKDGNKVMVRKFRRFFPRQYFMASLPSVYLSVIDKLEKEIETLKVEYGITREKADHKKIIDYSKIIYDLQKAYDLWDQPDALYDQEHEASFVFNSVQKHFKKVTHLIPDKYIRSDNDVYKDYLKHVFGFATRVDKMYDMLEAVAETPDPAIQNYLINQYRKSYGMLDSEGSLLGMRFTTRELGTSLGINPNKVKRFFQTLKNYNVFNFLSSWSSGLVNLTDMIKKVHEAGWNSWWPATQRFQTEEMQQLMLRRGILSFEDVIENHLLLHDDSGQRAAYEREIQEVKEMIAKANINKEEKKAELYKGLLLKVEQTPQITMLRRLADWAITGKYPKYYKDGVLKTAIKSVANLKEKVSIGTTERWLRGVSFTIGYTKAEEAGHDEATAVKYGVDFMNRTDHHLGSEAVGDMMGNELMQFLNHVRVWHTQSTSFDWQNMKDAWASVRPMQDQEKWNETLANNTTAAYTFAKEIMQVFLPVGASVGGGFALGGPLGGIVGGVAGYKFLEKTTSLKERRKLKRGVDPAMTRFSQRLLLSGLLGSFYELIVFGDAWRGMSEVGAFLQTAKVVGYRTGGHKIGSSMSSSLMRTAIALAILGNKWKSDDEEIEPYDFVRLFGSFAGIGYMMILDVILSAAYDTDRISRGRVRRREDYDTKLMSDFIPNIIEDFDFQGELPEKIRKGSKKVAEKITSGKTSTQSPVFEELLKSYTPQ